jgi:small multidrug resistance family-3 protein
LRFGFVALCVALRLRSTSRFPTADRSCFDFDVRTFSPSEKSPLMIRIAGHAWLWLLSSMFKAFILFTATAVAEIFGCYAVYLWLRLDRPAWWLVPGAVSLAGFAWLLTLHPQIGAGRVYAAYGGVYVTASLAWLWMIEGIRPDRWDLIGSIICLIGTAVILFGPRG